MTDNDVLVREIDRLRAENEGLRDMLREVSDDLASELDGRYQGVKDHPAMARRYERDMDSVYRARLFVNSRVVGQKPKAPTE